MIYNDFQSFYKTVGGNEGNKCHYPTRLDTYGCGCGHDCKYCYAKALLNFRNLWNPQNPSIADVKYIRKIISQMYPGEIVRLGGMTDCFQPCEKVHRITYKTIQMLNKRRVHYLIVTKSAIVADKEYLNLFDKNLAHIQITVTTTDDELCKTYEKASVPSKRIRAIETLEENGFDVSIRLSPFIPQYIDIDELNKIKCKKILIEFLRVNTWIKKWFPLDYSKWTVKQNGYEHLPLEIKKEYLKNIHFEQMTICEDETEAYEYWQNNFNFNKNDCCNLRL